MRSCSFCGPKSDNGQWWNLTDYFGFTGLACPDCYEKVSHKVSHDGVPKPRYPDEFLLMVLKHGK